MQRAGSPETCAVCELDPEFLESFADTGFRLKVRMVLVSKYFEPAERIELLESLGLKSDGGLRKGGARLLEEAALIGREARRPACRGYPIR